MQPNHQFQPGDVLIRANGLFGEHYGIFVQDADGQPVIAENQVEKGVQKVSLKRFLNGHQLMSIQKFDGLEPARQSMVAAIDALIGTSCDLVRFRCEYCTETAPLNAEEEATIRHLEQGMSRAVRKLHRVASMFIG
ncbi:MAG: hypothetical protein AAGB22_07125 [Bacteroidota bacterium]